eukprot:TRINITY_DN9446_c0_g4_i1.p1 TRINITY_DN9446_c0_g4~~TRINITY_DN9446_c0_g4_i1.p1  ORF type:complete len:248 (+),score=7.54 TRINITY_DN9446_c0_g4_i1:258-1001(+)
MKLRIRKQPQGPVSSQRKIYEKKKRNRILSKWSVTEDRKLFQLYKQHGSVWPFIAREFPNKTESQVKNRFYSTLRRVATWHNIKKNLPQKNYIRMSKCELVKYIDAAIKYGHKCFSKRGRKRKISKDTELDKGAIPGKRQRVVETGERSSPSHRVPISAAPLSHGESSVPTVNACMGNTRFYSQPGFQPYIGQVSLVPAAFSISNAPLFNTPPMGEREYSTISVPKFGGSWIYYPILEDKPISREPN